VLVTNEDEYSDPRLQRGSASTALITLRTFNTYKVSHGYSFRHYKCPSRTSSLQTRDEYSDPRLQRGSSRAALITLRTFNTYKVSHSIPPGIINTYLKRLRYKEEENIHRCTIKRLQNRSVLVHTSTR